MRQDEKTVAEFVESMRRAERKLAAGDIVIGSDYQQEMILDRSYFESQLAQEMMRLGFKIEWQADKAKEFILTLSEDIRTALVTVVNMYRNLQRERIANFINRSDSEDHFSAPCLAAMPMAATEFQLQLPGICVCRENVHRCNLVIAMFGQTEPIRVEDCDVKLQEILRKSWIVRESRTWLARDLPDPKAPEHWWFTEVAVAPENEAELLALTRCEPANIAALVGAVFISKGRVLKFRAKMAKKLLSTYRGQRLTEYLAVCGFNLITTRMSRGKRRAVKMSWPEIALHCGGNVGDIIGESLEMR